MNEITTALMGMGTGMRQSFVGKYELSTNCVGGIAGKRFAAEIVSILPVPTFNPWLE